LDAAPSAGTCQPVLELVDADASVRGEHAAEERAHVRVVAVVVLLHHLPRPSVIAVVSGLPRLLLAKGRVGLCHLVEPAQDEVGLDRQRLLAPEGAVVVEYRHARRRRHAVGGHPLDKSQHRLLGGSVVPRRE
jgi:hypothetical protein